MIALTKFQKFVQNLGAGHFNFGADTLKVMLSDVPPVVATAAVNTDITDIAAGNGYTAGGAAIAAGAWTNSASYSVTDMVIDAATNTKVSSVTHTFTTAEVGALLQVTAGAGWTAGYYLITSVVGGAAVLDHSPAAVNTTGGSATRGAISTLTGNAVTWTGTGGSIGPFRYAVLYDATTGYLLGFWDYGAEATVTNGVTFTLNENNQSTGGTILVVG